MKVFVTLVGTTLNLDSIKEIGDGAPNMRTPHVISSAIN
jgi:hypothetical protein